MGRITFADPHLLGAVVGGAEVQLWLLAEAFAKSGWETHYVTGAEVLQQTRNDVMIHHVEPGYANMRSCLHQLGPDLIYQRGRKDYTGLMGRYSAETGTPFVFSASMDLDCLRYKETYRLKRSAGLFTFLRRLPQFLRQDIATLKGMRSASRVLTQTEQQRDSMYKHLGIRSDVIANMHHIPEPGCINKVDPPIVLWLASIKQWKRPELFLKLVDSLAGQPYRFVLAGRMVDAGPYPDLIRNYESKYPNFEYLPNVDFEDSNRLIGEATVFVNTSLPYEGFPNTFIQAWLRRTPTVSMGFDPDNLIAQHGMGTVATNIEDLARQVQHIVSDRVARETMGAAAQKYAETAFGVENNFYKLENIAHSYAG